ncbi:MAG: hypothetical protein K6B40_02000 [Firmicutes bacterium]|nr:hypothetical protein [Bacillota bacterium]
MAYRKGIVDIGSNTVQLLLAEHGDEKWHIVDQQVRTTRLGQGLKEGILTETSMEATVQACLEYRQILTRAQAGPPLAVGTSAMRDAANAWVLQQRIAARCGWPVRILSGAEEAAASYQGALCDFPPEADLPVVDIGGGSTEIIYRQGGSLQAVSAGLGARRAQSCGWLQPQIREIIGRRFAAIKSLPDTAVGVGGTFTTAAGLLLGLSRYARRAVQGYILDAPQTAELLRRLSPLTATQRCAYSPLLAQRGEIILQGLWIVQGIFQRFAFKNIIVSAGGLSDGLLLQTTA